MTPTEINIAIAEACGAKWLNAWKSTEEGDRETAQRVLTFLPRYNRSLAESFEAGEMIGRDVPNYHSNLNAMHEAEKTLTSQHRKEYRWTLQQGFLPETPTAQDLLCYATAAERATAYVRTIGKWKD